MTAADIEAQRAAGAAALDALTNTVQVGEQVVILDCDLSDRHVDMTGTVTAKQGSWLRVRLTGPAAPVACTSRSAAGGSCGSCTGGWAALEDPVTGAPVPCPRCKPHLPAANVVQLRPAAP